jgi:Protein of unknown function (DUF2924)
MADLSESDRVLAAEIAGLPALSLSALRARWEALYGRPAPRTLRRDLLVRAIAYQLQVKAYGGLSAATRRKLREIAQAVRDGCFEPAIVAPRIAPGTRLIRVWRGETHTVFVHGDGFEWSGTRHRSLSTIAKAITGTSWNGWTFFGVKRARPSNGRDAAGRFKSHSALDGIKVWPRSRRAAAAGSAPGGDAPHA